MCFHYLVFYVYLALLGIYLRIVDILFFKELAEYLHHMPDGPGVTRFFPTGNPVKIPLVK